MAYTINKFNGEQLIVLDDGNIDTTTSLSLVGRNYVGYGEIQNENFVFLLENFANNNPPSRPLKGQIWCNTTDNVLYVYNGTAWGIIGAAELSPTAPVDPTVGRLWLNTTDNTLNIWTGSEFIFIGPESVPGFGITRAKSSTIDDSTGTARPVIFLEINDIPIAICSSTAFIINPSTPIANFNNAISVGINLSITSIINGNISGNAASANRLSVGRSINNILFDGQSNIVIKASTTNRLLKGDYITGENFNGEIETTWSVDATSANVIGKVVARNSAGGFAAGTITADLIGNLTGNVSSIGTSKFNIVEANQFIGATLSGNAFSASQLETPRRINGVSFNATRDIIVSAAAETLTGSTLNATISTSTLTSVGTLVTLNVADAGINVGSASQLRLSAIAGSAVIRAVTGSLRFDIGSTGPQLSFVNSASALALGGPNAPAIVADNLTNLGITGYKFNNVYANNFKGIDVEINSLTPTTLNGDITANGNLIVTGNFTVQGNVTAVNSTELTIEDKLITIASGAATASEANGAGIFIDGASASIVYSSSGNKWVFNKLLDMGINDITTTGLFRGTATSAQYADLAENYIADASYPNGTVLEIGGEFEVTLAQSDTNKIAGVVSTNPAYLMNSECKGQYVVAVALQGRTPCKVTGTIRKGDLLISAGNGYAKATTSPQFGAIIGKSLEDFNGTNGTIEVLVGRI